MSTMLTKTTIRETTRPKRVKWGTLGLFVTGMVLTAGVTLAASNNVLYLNGQVASTDLRTIGEALMSASPMSPRRWE